MELRKRGDSLTGPGDGLNRQRERKKAVMVVREEDAMQAKEMKEDGDSGGENVNFIFEGLNSKHLLSIQIQLSR